LEGNGTTAQGHQTAPLFAWRVFRAGPAGPTEAAHFGHGGLRLNFCATRISCQGVRRHLQSGPAFGSTSAGCDGCAGVGSGVGIGGRFLCGSGVRRVRALPLALVGLWGWLLLCGSRRFLGLWRVFSGIDGRSFGLRGCGSAWALGAFSCCVQHPKGAASAASECLGVRIYRASARHLPWGLRFGLPGCAWVCPCRCGVVVRSPSAERRLSPLRVASDLSAIAGAIACHRRTVSLFAPLGRMQSPLALPPRRRLTPTTALGFMPSASLSSSDPPAWFCGPLPLSVGSAVGFVFTPRLCLCSNLEFHIIGSRMIDVITDTTCSIGRLQPVSRS